MKTIGLDSLVEQINLQKRKILLLRYELFWNNFDYIFDNLETHFGIKIPENRRTTLKNKYNINKMKSIANKYKTFYPVIGKNYDHKSKIHGLHISKTNGEPNQWKTTIPQHFHEYVEKELEFYIKLFEYQ